MQLPAFWDVITGTPVLSSTAFRATPAASPPSRAIITPSALEYLRQNLLSWLVLSRLHASLKSRDYLWHRFSRIYFILAKQYVCRVCFCAPFFSLCWTGTHFHTNLLTVVFCLENSPQSLTQRQEFLQLGDDTLAQQNFPVYLLHFKSYSQF